VGLIGIGVGHWRVEKEADCATFHQPNFYLPLRTHTLAYQKKRRIRRISNAKHESLSQAARTPYEGPSRSRHSWSPRLPYSSAVRFRGYSRQCEQMCAPARAEAEATRPYFEFDWQETGPCEQSEKNTGMTDRSDIQMFHIEESRNSNIDRHESGRGVPSRPIAERSKFGS